MSMRISVASHISSIETGATEKPRKGAVTTSRSVCNRFSASRSGEKLNP